MKCDLTYEELALYSAGATPPARAREIETHLAACRKCRTRQATLRNADARLRNLPRHEPSTTALLEVKRALTRETRGASGNDVLTLDEAAALLRLSPDQFAEIADQLPAFEVGGQIRIRRCRLLEWIEQRERSFAKTNVESWVSRSLTDQAQETERVA